MPSSKQPDRADSPLQHFPIERAADAQHVCLNATAGPCDVIRSDYDKVAVELLIKLVATLPAELFIRERHGCIQIAIAIPLKNDKQLQSFNTIAGWTCDGNIGWIPECARETFWRPVVALGIATFTYFAISILFCLVCCTIRARGAKRFFDNDLGKSFLETIRTSV